MSSVADAATAAGATPLPSDWSRPELRCTKIGMTGQPRVLDPTRVIHHDGTKFSKLSVADAAERLAPLVAARDVAGHVGLHHDGRGSGGFVRRRGDDAV